MPVTKLLVVTLLGLFSLLSTCWAVNDSKGDSPISEKCRALATLAERSEVKPPTPMAEVVDPFQGKAPDTNNVSAFLLQQYQLQGGISSILKGDSTLKASVTTINQLSSDGTYFRAVVEIGIQSQTDGPLLFGYFPEQLRILDLLTQGGSAKIFDVTSWGLPKKNLWAHYKVSTGDVKLATDPNKLSKATINGNEFYYVASSKDTSDFFVPITTPDLAQKFRVLLLSPKSPDHFMLSRNGNIDLGDRSAEEGDGSLSFGLRGGGVTGWTPWNVTFLGVVDNVMKGTIDGLKPADKMILPPPVSK